MFSILRFVLIVGAIFYFSPVRQQVEGTAAIGTWLAPETGDDDSEAAHLAAGSPGHLEAVWKALPESAKQAVVDKILTASGLPMAGPSKSADTLLPEDREAASKPRT